MANDGRRQNTTFARRNNEETMELYIKVYDKKHPHHNPSISFILPKSRVFRNGL